MTNEELFGKFASYLDDVLNGSAILTSRIKEKTASTPSAAMRCHRYVEQAYEFLNSAHSVPDAPNLRPMNPQQTKQAVLDAVKSHAESYGLQEMTPEDYCSLPEGNFQRDALEIFFHFLQIQQATRWTL